MLKARENKWRMRCKSGVNKNLYEIIKWVAINFCSRAYKKEGFYLILSEYLLSNFSFVNALTVKFTNVYFFASSVGNNWYICGYYMIEAVLIYQLDMI